MTNHDRSIFWLAVLLLGSGRLTAIAASGQWVCFDSTFPEDFIDTRSIVRIDKRAVRFWERAGSYPNGDGHDARFPLYTLTEIDCVTHMSRALRWDIALEAGNSVAAAEARAKFMRDTVELQKGYPSDWESIDPSPHSYSRLDFVCGSKEH